METVFRATLTGFLGGSRVISFDKSYPNYPTEEELLSFYNDHKARLYNPGSLYRADQLTFEITVDKAFVIKQD